MPRPIFATTTPNRKKIMPEIGKDPDISVLVAFDVDNCIAKSRSWILGAHECMEQEKSLTGHEAPEPFRNLLLGCVMLLEVVQVLSEKMELLQKKVETDA